MEILPNINCHEDLLRLSEKKRAALCAEIRQFLISSVSQTGGHLAGNLGVVELTVALETVYDTAKDRLVFDVGHQSYVHKLLTGRRENFTTLRQFGGMSGFPKPEESITDAFVAGHASSAVSIALGMARARTLQQKSYQVVALMGDGAATGGMAYEGLNDAADSREPIVIVLNDNEMSIGKNVGGISHHFSKLRSSERYLGVKKWYRNTLYQIPGGKKVYLLTSRTKKRIKHFLLQTTIFENMGLKYFGPVDGHDVNDLISVIRAARDLQEPALVHVVTKKGKGYLPAEENPGAFHGIGKFDIDSGEPISSHKGFSAEFGNALCDLAEKDKKICAITAAMAKGTGLEKFSIYHKERFFDVGIAEEHAVTFACGLATKGMRPVFAVYSTFLQRAYDQIIHDAAMSGLHIVLAIDRAGIVGDDGETHQGVFDVSMLNSIPNVTIFSPTYFDGLKNSLNSAIYVCNNVAAVRYPRGGELYKPDDFGEESITYDIYGNKDCGKLIITYGRLFSYACKAKEILAEKGIEVCILKLCKIKPIDTAAFDFATEFNTVWFFEEGIKTGSVARNFGDALLARQFSGCYHIKTIGDKFVKQMSVSEALHMLKLDAEGMADVVLEDLDRIGNRE